MWSSARHAFLARLFCIWSGTSLCQGIYILAKRSLWSFLSSTLQMKVDNKRDDHGG
jgi:hypothetical protein